MSDHFDKTGIAILNASGLNPNIKEGQLYNLLEKFNLKYDPTRDVYVQNNSCLFDLEELAEFLNVAAGVSEFHAVKSELLVKSQEISYLENELRESEKVNDELCQQVEKLTISNRNKKLTLSRLEDKVSQQEEINCEVLKNKASAHISDRRDKETELLVMLSNTEHKLSYSEERLGQVSNDLGDLKSEYQSKCDAFDELNGEFIGIFEKYKQVEIEKIKLVRDKKRLKYELGLLRNLSDTSLSNFKQFCEYHQFVFSEKDEFFSVIISQLKSGHEEEIKSIKTKITLEQHQYVKMLMSRNQEELNKKDVKIKQLTSYNDNLNSEYQKLIGLKQNSSDDPELNQHMLLDRMSLIEDNMELNSQLSELRLKNDKYDSMIKDLFKDLYGDGQEIYVDEAKNRFNAWLEKNLNE
ncbi:hypothetical protein HN385_04005 [archaeon]|jgi:hypothetical protein|nr:hypothetical protein [archaeon]MBT3450913.1 hypothetical protein [archaeon]MBT6869095.1 hypothetical protein [archaeon]MBT7193338.1 hypothetical protein [archaeon]MBT7380346.1 hypothetical protein [archaeon]